MRRRTYSTLIRKLLAHSPDLDKLYHIARVLEESTDLENGFQNLLSPSQDGTSQKNKVSEDQKRNSQQNEEEHEIKTMNSFVEFPRVLKKQFLLPDAVFDQRLLRHELMVLSPIKREERYSWDKMFELKCQSSEKKRLKRQRTYLLMDCSASTANRSRLDLQKAIALLHLGSHQKGRGEVYYRSFNDQLGPLVISRSEKDFIELTESHLLSLNPSGQTHLQKALEQALIDITAEVQNGSWELLLISDGLTKIDTEAIEKKMRQVKLNIVLVGEEEAQFSETELREVFRIKHKARYQQLDKTLSSKEREAQQQQLEQLFQSSKRHLPAALQSEHIASLKKLCESSGGTWMHCRDLSRHDLSYEAQKKSLTEHWSDLKQALSEPKLTPLEKEALLLEYMALQKRLEHMRQSKYNRHADLQSTADDMIQLLENDHDLQDLILEQNLKFRFTEPGHSKSGESLWVFLLRKLKKRILEKLQGVRL